MGDLFLKQGELFTNYGILMTFFAFKDASGNNRIRSYFKDLNTGYLFNPMINKSYVSHASLEEAMRFLIEEAIKYREVPER